LTLNNLVAGDSLTLSGVGSMSDRNAGDDVSVAGATGAFSDKNGGAGKTVSVTGLLLGGADASNYVLTATTTTTTANITPRAITAVTTITANDKNYDGTTAVMLNTGSVSLDPEFDCGLASRCRIELPSS
jgi:hypothetical protein